MKEVTCPNCHTVLNCASDSAAAFLSGKGDYEPQNGDVSLCYECGHVSIWHNGLCDPTDEEILRIAGDPALVAAQGLREKLKAFVDERKFEKKAESKVEVEKEKGGQ